MYFINYVVNKYSKDFIRDEEIGSKRYLFDNNKLK